jgi:hypothetical protein
MSGKARISRAGLSYFLLNQDLKTRLLISERRPRAEHDDIAGARVQVSRKNPRARIHKNPYGKKVGRALHGAGAEGEPRSASTIWSVVA